MVQTTCFVSGCSTGYRSGRKCPKEEGEKVKTLFKAPRRKAKHKYWDIGKFLVVAKTMSSQTKQNFSTKFPLELITQPNDTPAIELKTYEFCKQYIHLPIDERVTILKELALKYDFDKDAAIKAASSYISLQDKSVGAQLKAAERLKSTLNPTYANAFSRIRKLDDFRANLCLQDKSVGAQLKAAERLKSTLNPTYANAFSRIRKLDDFRANLCLQDKSVGAQLKAAERLKSTLNPTYANAFSRIRKLDGGVKFLVDLRADLLNILPSSNFNDETTYYLKSLNNYLKEILSFSFNIGFLKLERITWNSSCDMLEKISQYEAVHPVRNWTDIKQRVGPYRRCYVFTHSSMPREPIVVLHTALTKEISSSISSIVRHHRQNPVSENPENNVEDSSQIQAAIFYSITSTQKGLHGIELGNQLIKKVVKEVLVEFPHIDQLSSLSPIPGFKEWLLLELKKVTNGNSVISAFLSEKERIHLKNILNCAEQNDMWNALSRTISSNSWIKEDILKDILRNPLMKICAHYLYNEKRRSNALNSVAHFHLRNGAVLWRLNWAADTSPRGLDNSCGMMVNYRYFINETEENSKNYLEKHYINASDHVKMLLTPSFSKSSL